VLTMSDSGPQKDRIAAIDYAKALAILAVVLTHSGFSFFHPQWTSVDHYLRRVLAAFHVPTFILVAGFLHATASPLAVAGLRRHLQRLLPPYILASIVGHYAGYGPRDSPGLVYELLTGGALGIYYFVFVLTICVLSGWVLSRSRVVLYGGLVLLAGYTVGTFVYGNPIFGWYWTIRDPSRWLGYYLLGWILRLHWHSVSRALTSHRKKLFTAGLLLMAGYVTAMSDPPGQSLIGVLVATYTLGVMIVLFCLVPGGAAPTCVRYLSENSYTIYLYHFFPIHTLLGYTRGLDPLSRLAIIFVVCLCFGLAVAGVGERVLGSRSRMLLGTR